MEISYMERDHYIIDICKLRQNYLNALLISLDITPIYPFLYTIYTS